MLVCSECKKKNITVLVWVDANTNEYKDEGLNCIEDNFCEDCQDHVEFKEIKEK